MAEDLIRIPPPPHIRPEWLSVPDRTIMDTSGTVLVTYDPQTRTGGVYRIEAGLWLLNGPLSLAEFAAGLPAMKLALPDGHDLQLWLDTVSAHDVPRGMTRQ